jgi:predicted RNA-binding protein with PUA-like domain
MKKIVLTLTLAFLLISCSKDNQEIETPIEAAPINSSEVNLAIGVKKDADLSLVLNTINGLNFDIRQMNGFFYNSNTPASGVNNLIDLLNQKTYINTGAWSATPYSVYYNQAENRTRILNSFFNMNISNQTDLINLITSLNLEDRLSETKNIYLSVPIGTHTYWKTQMLTYPFVKWTETFDQVCISYQTTNTSNAIVPTTGNVNQTISIPVTFQVLNGCGGFGNFIETNNGNTKTITVNAKYEGCYCTQAIEQRQTNYNFNPTTPGIYTLNFTQSNGNLLTNTINIQ